MQELEDITIGQYHIEHQLARGGMAEIYLARDLTSNQAVAIKMVHCSNTEYYERFRHEAEVMSSLQHDHILPALDHGEYESWYYLVTPYIAYGTLSERLSDGALSVQEAGEILGQLTDALQFAHERGIIHRDLKPSNVLLRDGKYVYLADFGLAKKVGENRGFTVTGVMMGTPEYIAPELAEEQASARSDIYALGVLLYQMLTGRVPFSASTPLAIFLKHVSEEPQRPSRYNASIPASVEKVILRALEKNPHRRFSTAAAMMDAYRRAMTVETPRVRVLEDLATLDIPVFSKADAQPLPVVKQRSRFLTSLVKAEVACLLLLLLSLGLIYNMMAPQPASILPHVVSPSIPQVTPSATPPTSQQRMPAASPTSQSVDTGAAIYWISQDSTSQPNNDKNNDDNGGKTHGHNGKGKGHGHGKH